MKETLAFFLKLQWSIEPSIWRDKTKAGSGITSAAMFGESASPLPPCLTSSSYRYQPPCLGSIIPFTSPPLPPYPFMTTWRRRPISAGQGIVLSLSIEGSSEAVWTKLNKGRKGGGFRGGGREREALLLTLDPNYLFCKFLVLLVNLTSYKFNFALIYRYPLFFVLFETY